MNKVNIKKLVTGFGAAAMFAFAVTSTGSAETQYPLEFTDSFGQVVVIEEEPERIISIAPNLTETIYGIGAGDKLIGRTDYCTYPEEVADVESIGAIFPVDIERVLSLDPDVVFVSTHFKADDAEKLAQVGVSVVTLVDEATVDGVYEMITALGEVLNRTEEAAARVEEMQSAIAEVTEAVKDLEAPSVYYVVGYGEYGDFTVGGDTFVGNIIETAGGENIAKDVIGWNYSLEELIESDPDIIIVPEVMREGFMTAPNYCELTAVKEGRVYSPDIDQIERQSYRNGEGVRILAEIFHPEVFEE